VTVHPAKLSVLGTSSALPTRTHSCAHACARASTHVVLLPRGAV
jgi:hypothetical protein